jgi:dipeptidyl aminopeptidase/acylaminoacyl peptidase
VFARLDGSLHAVAFDAQRLAPVGDPVLLLEGVLVKAAGETAADYDVSPDGILVYARGAGVSGTRLVRLARDGGEATLLEIAGDLGYPRFSPDGSRIVYALGMDLWVLDVVRGARTRITFGGSNRFVPLWTTDGSRVTHALGVDAENLVVSSAADGSGAADTVIALGPRKFPTSWSPDGMVLSLTTGPQGSPTNSRDLGMTTMEGTNRTFASFVETPFNERGAVFSPDGRWVAYVSDRSGRDEIYARPYPGPGAEVTLSVAGGQEPVWSRSGTELVYRNPPAFMVVSVRQESGSLQVGSAERLLADRYRREPGPAVGSYAYYDVAANGDLLVVDDIDAGVEGLVVVLNWLEELRARVPS